MRHNPRLEKKRPLKSMAPAKRLAYLDENIVTVTWGERLTWALNLHSTTKTAYFIVDPAASIPVLQEIGQGRRKGSLPFFMPRPISDTGTLDQFWRNPVSKKFAAAMQFCLPPGQLVVTHISTRPEWGRTGVAEAMLEKVIAAHGEGRKIVAHDMTAQGQKFSAEYSRRTGVPIEGTAHAPVDEHGPQLVFMDETRENPRSPMRRNPLLEKKRPLKRMAPEERKPYLDKNIVVVGGFGRVAALFGHHPSMQVAYFVIDPAEDIPHLREVARGGVTTRRGKKPVNLPLFQMRARLGSPGTISEFWKNPVTNRFAGAAQFCTPPGKLIVTHIATRAGWHRKGVASALLDAIIDQYGKGRKVYAHNMTDEGHAIFAMYSQRTGIPIEEIEDIPFDDVEEIRLVETREEDDEPPPARRRSRR